MRVIFVNRFYWPATPATGQLLADLSTALAGGGHDVTVVTSCVGGHKPPLPETYRGVRVIRVRTPGTERSSVIGKALAFILFASVALWHVFRQTRRGDVVVAMTDPPLLGLFAWPLVRIRQARLVHWIHDIYPEVAIAVSRIGALRVLRPARNASWRHADACVTLGQEMAGIVRSAKVDPQRVVVIPNWAPVGLHAPDMGEAALPELRHRWGLDGKFVVAYSGNLGRVHDLAAVLSAASMLRQDDRVVFAFIGAGAQRTALEAAAARENLNNLRFFPSQPRDQLAETLCIGDVHLVTLRTGCEKYVFPSKLYGIAAVGRPMLFVGPPECEVAEVVRHNGLGWVVDPAHPERIVATVLEILADPGCLVPKRTAVLAFSDAHRPTVAHAQWNSLLASLGSS